MKRLAAACLALFMPMVIGPTDFAAAQMHMAGSTMLVAQLDAKQVVGGSPSKATGTGAFLLDGKKRTLAFSLTYEGLSSGRASRVSLYNFGRGKNGGMVRDLCGGDATPCPGGASATISGFFEGSDVRLDNKLLSEFASERVYVEVMGATGKPEIRGQLEPNNAMVMVSNYTVDLKPAAGTESKGTGTAVVSETHLPGNKVAVFYAATVAGTTGSPTSAALVSGLTPQERAFKADTKLPRFRLRSVAGSTTGGSLAGSYEIDGDKPAAPFATRLIASAKGETGFVVTTNRYPNGELYGVLVPVH